MYIDFNQISRDIRNLPDVLSVDEKQRVSQYRRDKQKFQYLISRTILRLLLASYLEVSPKSILFSYSKRGKPEVLIDGHKKIFFNIAHTRDLTIFAFSEKYDLGVDVEYICKTKNYDQIAKQFFSKNEQRLLFSLQEEKRVDLFFEMWVVKEAYLKGTGSGIVDLNKIEVVYKKSSILLYDNITGKHISDWSFFIISPVKHFTACVALKCNEKLVPCT
ncbi:hypothetical protein A2592_03250 [Candidatus Kaiserbacteria bacterium RIFOXYD1_FULL_42_15]|uniref:Uncharacterized protein n=1 Tax=Candidatus Kaiserbacteria bacterium RIFOXYD1_FULL_42_15 TaxID=1798532 RepID=A0A1F6FPD7_9BACT|nr:MAG: hypothetical protein A2592_03250 [Candidatus Kaiserbacteria bacterium RIFOXYD1_FULL_42_15]